MLTCSAPTMLIGLHLNRWLINLGMKELKKRKERKTLSKPYFFAYGENKSQTVCNTL